MQSEIKAIIESLADEYEDFHWWIPPHLSAFEDELRKELPEGHPLLSRSLSLTAVARSERKDDVLFYDDQGYCMVHLTWSTSNMLPFPCFKEIGSEAIGEYLLDDYLNG